MFLGYFVRGLGVAWLLAASLWAPDAFAKDRRVALLIGNADYEVGRLRFPHDDVAEIRTALLHIGFDDSDIKVVTDADRVTMGQSVQEFARAAQGADVAFVYYSGHGAQANGVNWLIPLRASIRSEDAFELEAVSAQWLLSQIERVAPKLGILVLDACRDNPVGYAPSKGGAKGLARMDSSASTLIAFATAANETADDTGLYAKVLARQIQTPGEEIIEVFRATQSEVEKRTQRRQRPRLGQVGLSEHFYLAGRQATSQAAALPTVRNTILADEAFETANDGVSLLREALAKLGSLAALEAGALQGDAQANYFLGVAYLSGLATNQDLLKARSYLKRSSDMQFRRAQFAYAEMLMDGSGGPADKAEALRLWELGASQRFAPSMVQLGRYYAFNAPQAERHPQRARDLFKRATNDAPDALAMLGLMTLQGIGEPADEAAGLRLMEAAAAAHSRSALYTLAGYYRWGRHVPRDVKKALAYYEQAANLGATNAMVEAGAMLSEGEEVPPDIARGVALLLKASETHNAAADSALTKAFLKAPQLLPKGWPLADRAVAAAREGQLEGLVRLAEAYRGGNPLVKQDWQAADRLASLGMSLVADAGVSAETGWPIYAMTLGRTRIAAAEEGRLPTPASVVSDLKIRWGLNRSLKRFTIVVDCGGIKDTSQLYIWDTATPEPPTDSQIEWLKRARDCKVDAAVLDGFRKIYSIARENKVSFTDLAVYALSDRGTRTTGEAPAIASAANAAAHSALALAGQSTAEGAGLMPVIEDIGRYERVKLVLVERNRASLDTEDAVEQFLANLELATQSASAEEDKCRSVKVMGRERSKKAGEKAEVIRIDLLCSGQATALLLLPDDPAREATLYVRTRKDSAGAGTSFGTKYVIARGLGVVKSLHDLDGDGRPDSFGFHISGGAQPTRTLALSAGAM